MSTSAVNSRDDRWNYIDEKDPEGSIRLIREILQSQEERLSSIDVNGGGLVIPDDYVTEAMLADDSVGSSQIQANAVGSSELNAGAVGTTQLADEGVTTAKLADDAVTKAKLAGGFLKGTCIVGGAAGAHTVNGIAVGDELVLVARLDREAAAADINLTSITGEFSITSANTITNSSGTDTTGDALLVLYLDLT